MRLPVLPGWARVGLVGVTALAIALGSLTVGTGVLERTAQLPYNDELLHVLSYAGLALTATYAYLPATPRPLRRGLLVFGLVLAYGLAIEGLQSQVPGRQPDVGDGVADALGAATAFVWDALMARWVSRPR